MKKLFSLKNILICIAFTVFLLLVKDNMDIVFKLLGKIMETITPFLIGFIIAYILNFPYKFFYSKAFKKMGAKRKIFLKLKKPLSIVCTYALVLAILVILVAIIVPQITVNISNLVSSLPAYVKTFTDNFNSVVGTLNDRFNIGIDKNNIMNELFSKILSFFSGEDFTKFAGNTTSAVINVISSTAGGVYNFVMGVVISVYFLSAKESLCRMVKKLAVAFIPIKCLPKIYEIIDITDTKCGRFLVGDIIDSALIGVLTFIVMAIFRIPYAPLISVIVGVTNIIPFFGPYIGGIPSALLLLLIDPIAMIWFIIIIFVIQQLDGNLFKPKIIGNQVGISSFWVLFSVLVGGALFGIVGMILSTPIFAVIYSLVAKKARNSIEEKGKIAQEALDFEVLNYTKIAEEQRKLREIKENQQREKLLKIMHLNNKFEKDNENTDKEKSEENDNEG